MMGIKTQVKFKIVDVKEGSKSFVALVGWPQGWKMKASISLEKGKLKLKGEGKGLSFSFICLKEILGSNQTIMMQT